MLSREWIDRLVVIEELGRLPYVLRVAGRTLPAEFVLMRVLMTLRAFAAHPQEGLAFILHPDLGWLYFDASRVVATAALERCVFAGQVKPGHFAMVESLLIKLRELKPLAVMLVVTTRAIQLIARCLIDPGMIAGLRAYATGDFRMAVQALQRALADAKCVAACTL
jgi:SNF family Na+-dependent transporter